MGPLIQECLFLLIVTGNAEATNVGVKLGHETNKHIFRLLTLSFQSLFAVSQILCVQRSVITVRPNVNAAYTHFMSCNIEIDCLFNLP